jgi:hypothetical protein
LLPSPACPATLASTPSGPPLCWPTSRPGPAVEQLAARLSELGRAAGRSGRMPSSASAAEHHSVSRPGWAADAFVTAAQKHYYPGRPPRRLPQKRGVFCGAGPSVLRERAPRRGRPGRLFCNNPTCHCSASCAGSKNSVDRPSSSQARQCSHRWPRPRPRSSAWRQAGQVQGVQPTSTRPGPSS